MARLKWLGISTGLVTASASMGPMSLRGSDGAVPVVARVRSSPFVSCTGYLCVAVLLRVARINPFADQMSVCAMPFVFAWRG